MKTARAAARQAIAMEDLGEQQQAIQEQLTRLEAKVDSLASQMAQLLAELSKPARVAK